MRWESDFVKKIKESESKELVIPTHIHSASLKMLNTFIRNSKIAYNASRILAVQFDNKKRI